MDFPDVPHLDSDSGHPMSPRNWAIGVVITLLLVGLFSYLGSEVESSGNEGQGPARAADAAKARDAGENSARAVEDARREVDDLLRELEQVSE